MALGSLLGDIPHGLALASVYRACMERTWAAAVPEFARLAQLLEPALTEVPWPDAAERCPGLLQAFLTRIHIACSLRDFGIPKEDLLSIARRSMVHPHQKQNPRAPTPDEMLEIIGNSY